MDDVEKFVMSKSFYYKDKSNNSCVEVNIHNMPDTSTDLPESSLSVQNTTGEVLVIFCQDECIYQSSQLNENVWYVDRKTKMRKKETGTGIMVSGFTWYKFGFGMDMTNKQLQIVNTWRQQYSPTYINKKAAQFLN